MTPRTRALTLKYNAMKRASREQSSTHRVHVQHSGRTVTITSPKSSTRIKTLRSPDRRLASFPARQLFVEDQVKPISPVRNDPSLPHSHSHQLDHLRKCVTAKEMELVKLRSEKWQTAKALKACREDLTRSFQAEQRKHVEHQTSIERWETRVHEQQQIARRLKQQLMETTEEAKQAATLRERVRVVSEELQREREHHLAQLAQKERQIH